MKKIIIICLSILTFIFLSIWFNCNPLSDINESKTSLSVFNEPDMIKSTTQSGDNLGYWFTSLTDINNSAAQVKSYGHPAWRVGFITTQPYWQQSWSSFETRLNDAYNAASKNGIRLIVSMWEATGKSDSASLDKCRDTWIAHKDWFKSHSNVILNIANEWGQTDAKVASTSWRDNYVRVIKDIRNAGISNIILVDADGWGQGPKSIQSYGSTVKNAGGTVWFSIHLYNCWFEYTWCNSKGLSTIGKYHITTTIADMKSKSGTEICVGEFGDNGYGIYYDFNTARKSSHDGGAKWVMNWYLGNK